MQNVSMQEIFIYALWCWGSYGLIMGSFVYSLKQRNQPLLKAHIGLAFILSSFGMYSFILHAVRSLILHEGYFPLCWTTTSGKV